MTIIHSLLDNDLYKFTMQQAVLHHFTSAQVTYRFHCRTPNINLSIIADELQKEVDALANLSLTDDEYHYLKTLPFFTSDYLEFLRLFRFNPNYVSISKNNGLELTITGPWVYTILFEIPLLAIINELYFRQSHDASRETQGLNRLHEKLTHLKTHPVSEHVRIMEFGTRRRYSREWQHTVIKTLKQEIPDQLIGTSNVHFAQTLGLTPKGTMAHEFIQACQVFAPSIKASQRFAFDTWLKEYRGQLGIALSDTFGSKAFFNDYDVYYCKLFDGTRHDSGDPFAWGEQMLEHYQHNNIDSKNKILVFSDQLDIPTTIKLCERFHHRCKPLFGIGTNLTNDVGVTPISIVIKMMQCNGQPVAKLSNSPEKALCDDPAYLEYLKHLFE